MSPAYKWPVLFLWTVLWSFAAQAQDKYTLSGFIKDAGTGEELIGVSVYVKEAKTGVVTNPYGFYSITVPAGTYTIQYSYVGYVSKSMTIELTANRTENIRLDENVQQMEEIVVSAPKPEEEDQVQTVTMSRNVVNIEQVKKLPALFGEPDIIKTIQTMPGVVSAGEGTTGFFVRGGGADQNLMLIDEAPVYDASHFFGLFSVFNADVVKGAQLYKGGIPAQYGGRLSSILDVRTKDGNNQKFGGSATISNIAAKAMLEGPIQKDKSSFLVSARRSYIEAFMPLAPDPAARDNKVYFYDFNAKVNFKPTNKDRVFVAGYFGRDVFRFGSDFSFSWGNQTATVRWNHLYSDRLFSNTTAVFSNFDYKLVSNQAAQGFEWSAYLREFSVKQDLNYYLSTRHLLTFGASASHRSFNPGTIAPKANSIFTNVQMERMYAMDYALYADAESQLGAKWVLQYGLRYSLFQNMGETTLRIYDDPQNNVNIRYTERHYRPWETIQTYQNLEPRFSARYLVSTNQSLKFSYNRMAQYLHLLSNSTVPVPFNTWSPSSPYLKPQLADQVALGYVRTSADKTYELSTEVFYKDMSNVTDFADNANLLLNSNVAVEYRQGTSRAYGWEVHLQKHKGRLTGYVSYTLSRVTRDIPGVNNGQTFFANHDRLHSLNVVGTYELNKKWSFGAAFTYGTGRPITLPAGRYEIDGQNVAFYTERNGYRLPDFHRLDLSATLDPRRNEGRSWKSQWVFTLYNAYNRQNPFTVYTRTKQDDDGNIIGDGSEKEARLVYLFPIFPSVAYNIKF